MVLAFALPRPSANALTVENVSVSDTGGVSVSAGAEASGSSGADAEVRSMIRTEGSDTRVNIEVRTAADGEEHATSVERVLRPQERLDARSDATSRAEVEASDDAAPSSVATPVRIFERITVAFARIFDFLFFFLR